MSDFSLRSRMYPGFLLAFVAILPGLLSATHIRAGEIVVSAAGCGGGSDPLVACATIITYTETAQTEVDRDSLQLDWGDGSRDMIGRTRIVNVGPGVQRNEYRSCHAYGTYGRYHLSFEDVNRVRNVRNINNSVNVPFSVFTSFSLPDPTVDGCNSLPELTQHPIDNTCIGSVWTHNPGAFDADGDSLAFEFTVPTYARHSEISHYVLPNEVGGTNGRLSIDPRTGQITWDRPAIPGEYNLTFLVKSFRSGVPMDTVVRDLQIFVDDCSNEAPVIKLATEEITVIPGEIVEFEVVATDPTAEGQLVTLTATGRPFTLVDNPATFTESEEKKMAPVRKTFRWVPTAADVSEQAYFVVIRAEDDGPPEPSGLATLRAVTIRVAGQRPPAEYQLFRPGVQYLYENPEFKSRTYGFDGQFYGVRVASPGCGELYGSLQETSGSDGTCVVKVPSPFGYRICQTPDSTVMDFGAASPLVIYQSAPVGTRWLARDRAGSSLYAEVLSVAPARVLGIPDTLKSIGFYTEEGDMAGPTVTIGKHTGLIDGSRFYQISQEALPLSLAGLSEPRAGVQLPSPDSYGLAEVGDTLQVAAENAAFSAGFFTVVVRAVDSSAAGVYSYEVAADLYRTEGGQTVPFALDTVYTFSRERLPVEMMRQPGARRDSVFLDPELSDVLKVFRDSCGLIHQRLSTTARFEDGAACGLDESGLDAVPGAVYVERVPFALDVINTQAGPHSLILQYLGSETLRCGTYLNPSDILLSSTTLSDQDAVVIGVYPNPATESLTVKLPANAGPFNLDIYSLSGQRLQSVRGVRDRHTWSLEGMVAGSYFLIVSNGGRPVARRRVIVR